jgi:geranylgeranyl diphosphate synthase, type II
MGSALYLQAATSLQQPLTGNTPVTVSATDDQPVLDLERLRPQIDQALDRYTQLDDACPAKLAEAIRYALLGPGKRLRPQLVLMATEACGGPIEAAMPAACAIEMVHAYSLVHDDLPAMDDDDLRRGRPTCHKQFGEAVAILVGDALLAKAFEILASRLEPPAVAAKCCAILSKAAGPAALVGGQAADLESEHSAGHSAEADLERLEAIHSRKTGALFIAAMELGGVVAQASPAQLAALAWYGQNIGLAFQITDDLLDVAGDQAAVGKRVSKDASNGKLTFPGLLGIKESQRRAHELVDQACAMIEVFGPQAEPLRQLARFVCARDS